jgi:CRISPR-associated protein Csb1
MSLLDVGHRVADAAIWSADGYDDFKTALEAYVQGDAWPLAKLAPTSLVFGYWDSRGKGGKARRLVRGEIFAENVVKLTRRSQYWASVDPEASEDLQNALDQAKAKAKGDKEKDIGSQLGFRDAPASGLGGIIAHGDIARLTILSLTGVRNLLARGDKAPAKDNEAQVDADVTIDAATTLKLRRYIFALALASASTPRAGWDLREGCLLVQSRCRITDSNEEREVPDVTSTRVFHDGREEPWEIPSATQIDAYLKATANELFGGPLPQSRTLTFNPATATGRVRAKLEEKGKPTATQAGTSSSDSAPRGRRSPRRA